MNFLVLPGFTRQAFHLEKFAEHLRQKHPASKIIVSDNPGFGRLSDIHMPPTVAEAAEIIRARMTADYDFDERWTIIGQSFGGMIALEWTARYPDDFGQAVLINVCAPGGQSPWQRNHLDTISYLPKLFSMRDHEKRENVFLEMTTRIVSRKRHDRLSVKKTHEDLVSPRRDQVAMQVFAAMKFKAPIVVDTPLRFFVSSKDHLIDPSHSLKLCAFYKSKLYQHQSAGHDLIQDDPVWLINHISS